MKNYNNEENFEIITDTDQILEYFKSFEIQDTKNFILDFIIKSFCNGHLIPILTKSEDGEYTVFTLPVPLNSMLRSIQKKEKLVIENHMTFLNEAFDYNECKFLQDNIVEYENDVKLYIEQNFDQWYEKQKELKTPKIYVFKKGLNHETICRYLYGYYNLFSIPGDYKCTEIIIHYDDIIDVNIFIEEKFPYLTDLIREKTIREVIKVREEIILLPLNNINLKNMSFIPMDRNYTKKELKYLNQKKIKELCYYLKLGYTSNEIFETGILGKSSIYNNTRKLLIMGIFTRDQINIKFPDSNNEFMENYYRKTMLQRWKSMIDRCYNPDNESYHNYGGRGITVCNEWRDPERGFENYYYDIVTNIGFIPGEGYSLDRIKNNGNYTIGNVRWATISQQNFNRSFKRNKK